jgi:hypothetical protein
MRYLCCDGEKNESSNPPIRLVLLSINSGDASRASELTCTQKAQVLALANKPDYGKEKKRKKSTNYREIPRLAELKKTSQAPVHVSSRPPLPITCFRLGQIHRFICLSVVSSTSLRMIHVGKIRSILAPLSMYTYIHVNLAWSQ